MFLKTHDIEFDNALTFADQNVRPLQIGGKVNLGLLIDK